MDKITNVAYGVIAVVVIVLVIATTLIPVVDSVQHTQSTAVNNEQYLYLALVNDEEIEITPGTGKVTVNNVDYTQTGIIASSENLVVIVTSAYLLIVYDFSIPATYSNVSSVTISNGEFEADLNSGTVIGDLYIITNDITAENANYHRTTPYHINVDNEFTAVVPNLNLKDAENNTISIRGVFGGTITDCSFYYAATSANVSIDVDDLTVTLDPSSYELSDDGLSYLVTPNSITVVYDNSGTEYTGTVTGITHFAPIKYNTITANDTMIIQLLGIIPLILLIVPIMVVIRLFSDKGA